MGLTLQPQVIERHNVLVRVTAIVVASVAFLLAVVLIFGRIQLGGISEVVGVVSALVGVGGLFLSYLSFRSQSQQRELDEQQARREEQRARDAVLQDYFEEIRDLMAIHGLSQAKVGDWPSRVARTHTLTAVRKLDARQKRDLLLFIHEAGLIDEGAVNLSLSDADLSSADLEGADLRHAILVGANLRGANLRGANLVSAYLRDANLGAADLSGAVLQDTQLHRADLEGANLRGANGLSMSDLLGSNLKGATMPDGTMHP